MDADGLTWPTTGPRGCDHCRARAGTPHAAGCVVVKKRVRLRYTYEVEVDVPHDWDREMIEFHRNDGTWCADNSLDELAESQADGHCLCGRFRAEFVEVTDGTPRVKED